MKAIYLDNELLAKKILWWLENIDWSPSKIDLPSAQGVIMTKHTNTNRDNTLFVLIIVFLRLRDRRRHQVIDPKTKDVYEQFRSTSFNHQNAKRNPCTLEGHTSIENVTVLNTKYIY